jgi:uncharacterized membrane protein
MTSATLFRTVEIETGKFAVVRTDCANPRIFEVVATFYEALRAEEYAAKENAQSSEQQPGTAPEAAPKAAPRPAPKLAQRSAPKSAPKKKAEPEPVAAEDLTDRQSAVLKALRSKMDSDKSVESKAAELADAAGIPLGSLHSILQSLEKKELIRNTRAGSAKAPAVYQIL